MKAYRLYLYLKWVILLLPSNSSCSLIINQNGANIGTGKIVLSPSVNTLAFKAEKFLLSVSTMTDSHEISLGLGRTIFLYIDTYR